MRRERAETRPHGRSDEDPPRRSRPPEGRREPADDAAIDAGLPPCGPAEPPPPDDVLLDRIRGGWLGRCGAARSPGAADRGDTVDRAVLTLRLLETYGPGFTHEQMASLWLPALPFLRAGGAERAAYRLLVEGGLPPWPSGADGGPEPCQEAGDALPRADLYGYIAPGDPRRAARLARKDAQLSHAADGLYAAMWVAALASAAFTARDAEEAVAVSLRHIPVRSRLSDALCDVLVASARARPWAEVAADIHRAHGRFGEHHAVGNACLIAAALLWGRDDWGRSVALAAEDGWDTRVDTAVAGSVAGVLAGTAGIPAEHRGAAADRVHTAVPDAGECRITDLAARTYALAHGR
ncbi:ADP-ribosylglycohydrolase family protein [Yinghuangia sp. ASG 101]|uniref:ADP-ribosylglycohydrolase family protein n=1 Tax=Yinghuangia sp. ASG 101 TaxID=2896848 RepID=UPI001E5EF849|nr:ADP-ribosylglycohydrolase family protein [Yinghuangia sp. ASG 101]UGQ10566.1 ADP-ribosylglycohydrolase family protein [Yinghuangia sp. ASG 101]